jgi:C4-type Zn-finger protein
MTMHGTHDADFSDDQRLALIHYCPNCEVPRVMSLEAIRPAMFGKRAIIGYRCETCATRRVDVVSYHALGPAEAGGSFHRRLTDGHNPAQAL